MAGQAVAALHQVADMLPRARELKVDDGLGAVGFCCAVAAVLAWEGGSECRADSVAPSEPADYIAGVPRNRNSDVRSSSRPETMVLPVPSWVRFDVVTCKDITPGMEQAILQRQE
jgi:hypothetical protein